MPYSVRKRSKGEGGKLWKIYNKDTGAVKGESDSKKKAHISASYRNKGHKK